MNQTPFRVLVVDDEPGIRRVCLQALAGPCVGVETAGSGDEAIARLPQGWDLVLTDLAMPGGADGIEVLNRARSRGTSVIIMSAYPDLGATLAGVRQGASDFLLKPFTVGELQESFARWRASREPASEPRAAAPPGGAQRAGLGPRSATSLFADIRGFSRFAASAPPGEVGAALGEVLGPAMEAVRAAGGAVQQIMGDGFLALFGGDPDESAACAAAAALECRQALSQVSRRRSREGKAHLPMGFGLETGLVRAETLGAACRGQLTFVGNSVNLAARLEKAAGPGVILVGPEAGVRLLGRRRLDPVRPLVLHGFDEPVPAFALLD